MGYDCDNSGDVPLRVPGFGLGIAWGPSGGYDDEPAFEYGPHGYQVDRMTVRELAMVQLMDAITDKPDWHRKITDPAITAKWRKEAAAVPGSFISDKAFDWCITELSDHVAGFEKHGLVRTMEGGMRVIKSDIAVSPELQQELREAVKPLLQVDEAKKDWHPNSDDQVLNLVHPSLYPLVYGRTRVLETGRVGLLNCMDSAGAGKLTEGTPKQEEPEEPRRYPYQREPNEADFWSNQFQWLPAEVEFQGESGTEVKITSYINNLHPVKFQHIYPVIEKLISIAIPAWNGVLVKGYEPMNKPRIQVLEADTVSPDPPHFETEWDEADENSAANQEIMAKLREYLRTPNRDDCPRNDDDVGVQLPPNWETAPISQWEGDGPNDWDGGWTVENAVDWKESRLRTVILPEPGESPTYPEWKSSNEEATEVADDDDAAMPGQATKLEEEYRRAGLQVIVKIASIELTPDKPEYAGGSWHLEGMKNEHIAATALYYYDVCNCSPSRLSFRQEASLDELELVYEQSDHAPLSRLFGTEGMYDEPAVQSVGGVDTRDGRLLVFPNTMQHRVEPFRLADPARPGHRRFVALWLVDPMYRVLSTANVPPQHEEWWDQHVRVQNWERELPQEIRDQIIGYAKEDIISLDEAKRLRLELMKERTRFADKVEHSVETYNLCEH